MPPPARGAAGGAAPSMPPQPAPLPARGAVGGTLPAPLPRPKGAESMLYSAFQAALAVAASTGEPPFGVTLCLTIVIQRGDVYAADC